MYRRNRKLFTFAGAALACVAAIALTVDWGYPQATKTELGADWRCHHAVIVTTCTRVSHVQPMLHRSPPAAAGLQPV